MACARPVIVAPSTQAPCTPWLPAPSTCVLPPSAWKLEFASPSSRRRSPDRTTLCRRITACTPWLLAPLASLPKASAFTPLYSSAQPGLSLLSFFHLHRELHSHPPLPSSASN